MKLNYGEAYPQLASKETFQVEVIGEVEPVEVTEEYLAQIISARLNTSLNKSNKIWKEDICWTCQVVLL